MSARRLRLTLLGGILALATLFIWRNRTPLGLLEPGYTDHLRHLRFTWEFLHQGLGIFSTPMHEFERTGDARAYIWQDSPYLYPPGALALFLVPALGEFSLGMSSWTLSRLLLTEFMAATVFSVSTLWRSVRADDGLGAWFLIAAFFLLTTHWSLNGQYDAVPLALLALGGRASERPARRLLWLSGAIFLKYQALLYVPLLVQAGLIEVRQKGWREVARSLSGRVSLGLLAASAGALFLARHHLAPARANPLHLSLLFTNPRVTTAHLIVVTVALAAVATREWMLAITVAWIGVTLGSVSQLQGWYVPYLIPVWAYLEGARARNAYIGFLFALAFVIGWLPDPFGTWERIRAAW